MQNVPYRGVGADGSVLGRFLVDSLEPSLPDTQEAEARKESWPLYS